MYLRTGFFINCSLQSERSESREPIFGLWVAVVVWATEGGGGAYEGKWRGGSKRAPAMCEKARRQNRWDGATCCTQCDGKHC